MTLERFQQMIAEGLPLEGAAMIQFMREQSDESRKIQMELNTKHHTPEEVRTSTMCPFASASECG